MEKILHPFVQGFYRINPWDQSIDIIGSLIVFSFMKIHSSREIAFALGGKSFFSVSGDFSIQNCEMKSLEGSPRHVGGDFNFSYNQITSLEGCPHITGKDFIGTCNLVKDPVVNHPLSIRGDVYLYENPLHDTFKDLENEREVIKDILLHFNNRQDSRKGWDSYSRLREVFY
jgi:hypothetical protein